MMRFLFVATGLCLSLMASAQAQLVSFNIGMFSRANCINNESITWERHMGDYWKLGTTSVQSSVKKNIFMLIGVPPTDTWRAAAINGFYVAPGDDWEVNGEHDVGISSEYVNFPPMHEALLEVHQDNCVGEPLSAYENGSVVTCNVSFAVGCNALSW